MTDHPPKSTFKGIMQLLCSLFVIWSMTYVVMPAITNSNDSFRTLADFIDSSGIDTGQFYYTDVEIVTKANIGTRSTIEYFTNRKK